MFINQCVRNLPRKKIMDKVWLQTVTTPLNILNVNFNKSTIKLHFLLISSKLTKFPNDQRVIVTSPIKCLNFKFLQSKIMHKK